MKVLLVDDDIVSRMMLMHMVDSCGPFHIIEAENGAEAWELIEAGLRPAICFCDLRMPRMSGQELLARVRELPELDGMPFVLVSSANDTEVVRTAAATGATGFICKPFSESDVRAFLAGLPAPRRLLAAETPAATLRRLNIDAARLLAYLGGLGSQLVDAVTDLPQLAANGDLAALAQRLERLTTGCRTLGLEGCADALALAAATLPEIESLRLALADAQNSVQLQGDEVRRWYLEA
jgi:two-component system chemotaxis response regulator CheY